MPVIARFAIAFLVPQLVATVLQQATLPPAFGPPSILLATIVTAAGSTIGATSGFALALGLSERFYLPLVPRLRRAAYTSALIVFLFLLGSCCAFMSEFHPVAMFAFPLVLSAFVSAIVLEHERNRALKILRQGDACLTCGYTIAGAPHEVCPECGGPILRRTVEEADAT